jgi:hypothetical protein
MVFGILGGLLILFEFALWPRKKVRAWRLGRAQTWMRAHIWLGLLTVPLIVLHTGFRMGGVVPTVLLVLFAIVIASGVFGLWMQQVVPRMMLEQAAGETIYTQVDRVSKQLANEADAILRAVGGGSEDRSPRMGATVEVASVSEVYQTGEHVYRPWQVKTLERQIPVTPLPDVAKLAAFHRDELEPYLLYGDKTGSRLADSARAAQVFDTLRRQFGTAAYAAVDALEQLSRQRHELDLQVRLHRWLHVWLAFHLPLSAALVVLMFVHIYTAVRYW